MGMYHLVVNGGTRVATYRPHTAISVPPFSVGSPVSLPPDALKVQLVFDGLPQLAAL